MAGVYVIREKPKTQESYISKNGPFNENGPLFFSAGLACLVSVPLIYAATRPMVWLNAVWTGWVLSALFTLLPLAVVFIILYSSAWHQEWSKGRRIFSAILSSCLIYGLDLFLVIVLAVAGCLVVGLSRVMGGN
jgi:hypothetical protein